MLLKNISIAEIIFDDDYSTRYDVRFKFANQMRFSRVILDYQKVFNEFSMMTIEIELNENENENDFVFDETISPKDRLEIMDKLTSIKGLF